MIINKIQLGFRGLILGLMCLLSAQVNAQSPEDVVKSTVDVVLADIKVNLSEYKKSPQKLYNFVDENVLKHFDFNRMTNLALGRYQRKLKGEQREQMTSEFRNLLVRTYSKALLEYEDQVINFLPSKGSVAKGEVTIRTEIDQQGGFPIPINYRLYLDDKAWKVYDISVDNVSLVTNYRASFSRIIKKSGIDGLIKSLKEKNQAS